MESLGACTWGGSIYQAGFSGTLLDLKLLALRLSCFTLLSDIVQLCLQVLVTFPCSRFREMLMYLARGSLSQHEKQRG